MTTDPLTYILFAALVGGGIGFFGACILTSRAIKEARITYWRDGYAAANRDHSSPRH